MSINNDFLSSISIFYGGGNLKRRICVSIPPLSVHLPSRFINPNHIGTQKMLSCFLTKKLVPATNVTRFILISEECKKYHPYISQSKSLILRPMLIHAFLIRKPFFGLSLNFLRLNFYVFILFNYLLS